MLYEQRCGLCRYLRVEWFEAKSNSHSKEVRGVEVEIVITLNPDLYNRGPVPSWNSNSISNIETNVRVLQIIIGKLTIIQVLFSM